MIQPLLEVRAKKCTNFRWFFGGWENLVLCFRYLLTFRVSFQIIKEKKSWEPFRICLLIKTANPAQFWWILARLAVLSSFFKYETIETFNLAFLSLIISAVGSVVCFKLIYRPFGQHCISISAHTSREKMKYTSIPNLN